MCGISGVYSYRPDGPLVDRDELRAVRDHMHARGPDGKGEWYADGGRVGLAHRRLAIIDLSNRAAQPMATADGRFAITFNGEIYNYRELKRDLEARGCIFRTESDTEVLLQLYARKGEAMLGDLRGMFAFAIWDSRDRTLVLARDPFGIKPLYYGDDGKSFRFASQVKALLAGGQINTLPEPAGHAGFFLWGSVPTPWTLFRGVRSLPAGHVVRVSPGGAAKPAPYCLIEELLAEAVSEPAKGTVEDALRAIGEVVRDSVRAHLVADVPVASFLSAGLDSAMITSLASGLLRDSAAERPHTLTLAFAEFVGTKNDEAPMAEMLAALIGTRHATLMVRREDFEEECEQLIAAMDQPSIDGVNTWFVARAAASQGIKVALSGVGGDEIFASYPSFSQVPRIARLAAPFSSVPRLARWMRQVTEPVLSRFTSPKFAGLLEYGHSLGGAYLLRRALYMPWELGRVVDPEIARQGLEDLQTNHRLDRFVSVPGFSRSFSGLGDHSSRHVVSALEMSWYMSNQLLRDTDWASMAHSLEVRVPFLDMPLLKAVAPWLAAHPSISKSAIASTIMPDLSAGLLRKPKTGFSIPVRDWLLSSKLEQSERGLRGWARYIHKRLSE